MVFQRFNSHALIMTELKYFHIEGIIFIFCVKITDSNIFSNFYVLVFVPSF